MSSIKQPPVFNPSEDDDYASWKADVEIWQTCTSVEATKQGPAVYLSLRGRAKDAARGLTAAELGVANGVKVVTDKLDGIFLADESTRAYCAFKELIEYRRASGVKFSEFIVDFERLDKEVAKYMALPTGCRAFFLLHAANLAPELEKLARATSDLDYDDMKSKLMKIFGDPKGDFGGGAPMVKQEALVTQQEYHEDAYFSFRGNRGGRRGRGGRGGYRGNRGNRGSRGDQQRRNPRDAYGQVLRCHECESTKHFVTECPHRHNETQQPQQHRQENTMEELEEAPMTVHITLFSGMADARRNALLIETFGKAILDSACTKTVAGSEWIQEFLATLSKEEMNSVLEQESKASYLFGDGAENRSTKCLTLPVWIGQDAKRIDVEVVKNRIPLLFSKATMKEMGMKVDFSRDIAFVGGKQYSLGCTSMGHYFIPVTKEMVDLNSCNVVLHAMNLKNLSRKEKLQKALKLHRQLSHASKEKLIKVVENSRLKDPEFVKCLEECIDVCKLCQEYRKAPLRPVVSIPKDYRFNDVVSMDLKELTNIKSWILHLIDVGTRYSQGCIVKTKCKNVIVKKIFQIWVAYFGCPGRFHSDNGGEFANDVFTEMNEKLGVETSTTPAESPFSNGVVERHNAVLYETMMKTMQDVGCEVEIALAWALSSKNTLTNKGGFSPNQLVFGFNTNLPTLLTDLPPALETTTSSDIVRKNLEAIHSARANVVKAQNSDVIRRALKHKLRTSSETNYVNGDKVFYKRKDTKGWKGPGKVLGSEGNFVLIRHGSFYQRCHPCHLMKVVDGASFEPVEEEESDRNAVSVAGNANEIRTDKNTTNRNNNDNNSNNNLVLDGMDTSSDEETVENQLHPDYEIGAGSSVAAGGTGEGALAPSEDVPSAPANIGGSCKLPKPNDYVKCTLKTGDTLTAKILSRSDQPKKTGKNKDYVNVHVDGADKPSSVKWTDVTSWENIEEPEHVVLFTATEEARQDVLDAKEREISSLVDNDVFEWAEDQGQKVITTKWVFTEKDTPEGGKKVKARLVARGFEENSDDLRTDSPTCSRQALRLVFVAAATMNWELQSLDITAAFLQGNILDRDVFIQPPVDYARNGMVWKLRRCLYGLKDAPRAWYKRVVEEFKKIGGKMSLYDDAMFMWHARNGSLVMVLVTHVDDFVYCGRREWVLKVIGHIRTVFKISFEAQGAFKYTGLNVVQRKEGIMVDQNNYIASLDSVDLSKQRLARKEEDLTTAERTRIRSLGGQLLWVTTQTRPDASYDSCWVSNYGKNPNVRSLVDANKAVRKLQMTKSSLLFPPLGDPRNIEVLVYQDASHANLPNGASQGGLIVFLSGNGRVAPLMWSSKKLKRVTKSPLASEASILTDAADAGFLASKMVQELFGLMYVPCVTSKTDSKSLWDHLNTTKVTSDARLRVDVACIREMIKLGEIKVDWVEKSLQLADCLTKAGASSSSLLDVLRSGIIP